MEEWSVVEEPDKSLEREREERTMPVVAKNARRLMRAFLSP